MDKEIRNQILSNYTKRLSRLNYTNGQQSPSVHVPQPHNIWNLHLTQLTSPIQSNASNDNQSIISNAFESQILASPQTTLTFTPHASDATLQPRVMNSSTTTTLPPSCANNNIQNGSDSPQVAPQHVQTQSPPQSVLWRDQWVLTLVLGLTALIVVIAAICGVRIAYSAMQKQKRKQTANHKRSVNSGSELDAVVIDTANTANTAQNTSNSAMYKTDFRSSSNYHGCNFRDVYYDDYVVEKTTSNTSPTPRWLLCECLGKGRFGFVNLCIDLEHKPFSHASSFHSKSNVQKIDTTVIKKYAIKRAQFEVDENGQNIANKECNSIYHEMRILVDIKHEHIIQFYGSALCHRSILLFIEYHAVGTVSALLKECGALDLLLTQKFVKQLLSALQYLHSVHIVHRDIKGRNILVSDEMNIKLTDFGSALIANDASQAQKKASVEGTIHWMPPEVFLRANATTQDMYKHDIWSLGVTTVEMLTLHPLYYRLKPMEYVNFMKHQLDRFKIPEMDHAMVNSFIRKCLTVDFKTRPCASELLETDAFVNADAALFETEEKLTAPLFEQMVQSKVNRTTLKINRIVLNHAKLFGENQSVHESVSESVLKFNSSFDVGQE